MESVTGAHGWPARDLIQTRCSQKWDCFSFNGAGPHSKAVA
jgi:hypothetical protein